MAQYLCCDCEYLNRNDEYKDWFSGKTKYKCKECWQYKDLQDPACSKIRPITKNNGSYTPSGCYITTIVCEILGYEDNCELLCILRNFRDNVLKADPQYLQLLVEYDQIGPLIANYLRKEKNNITHALMLMNYFLIPCVNAIKNNNIDEAVTIYKNMVNQLKDELELPEHSIISDVEIELESLGKGRIRIPKTSEI